MSNIKLSNIAEIVMGQSPKGEDVNTQKDGFPLLNGPTEFTSRYPLPTQYTTNGKRFSQAGDILFCVRGSTTGRMNYADQEYAIGRGIGAIRGINGFPTPFVRAVIEINLESLLQAATGSTFPNLSRDTLNNFEVKYVTPDEATKINQFIVSIENKIYINQQANQTLEAMIQALFKSWFIDFEPVKAKIAALEAGGSEKDANLAAMQVISGKTLAELKQLQTENSDHYQQLHAIAQHFPAAMQDSELGVVPEGWEARPFGEYLKKTIGGDWGKEEPDEKHTEQVRILRGTDLPNVYAGDDSRVPTRFVEAKKLKTRKLQPFDIVIEVSGGSKNQPTGRSLLLTEKITHRIGDSTPASFCRLFRPKSKYLAALLGVHLQCIYEDGKTWQYQNQSTGISNFQTKTFLESELVLNPGDMILRYFFDSVISIFEKIHSNENQLLGRIRDELLPKLLAGELPVTNLEEASHLEST